MSTKGALVALVVAAAVTAGLAIVLRSDYLGEKGPQLAKEFKFDIGPVGAVDPALIRYRQVAAFDVGLEAPRGIAVGQDNCIHVAGDRSIVRFSAEGRPLGKVDLQAPPQCLAIAEDGTLYVAMADHVEVLASDGTQLAKWVSLGPQSLLTSIAVGRQDVAVADYGSRSVLHYDTSGKLLGRIGAKDGDGGDRSFVVPSPYFDVAFAPDGLLRIVNPGRLRVEAYTLEGDREFHWGSGSTDAAGFVGCCNPAHIAIFPDGRIVTSEKGVRRVKVYQADRGFGQNGVLECAVAAPETFSSNVDALDLAVDSTGRVLVLDAGAKTVRVFAPSDSARQPTSGQAK
jgi:sugar lactone lactonase YvrE